MILQRNLLDTMTLLSSCGTIVCIVLKYVTDISPLPSVLFYIYTLLLFIFSVGLGTKLMKFLLRPTHMPLSFNMDYYVREYPVFALFAELIPCPSVPAKPANRESREYDTNELSVISTVLERKLVSSWYTHYVSQEIGFPFACKQMLDQMIGKTFQICNKIDTKDLYVDLCTVLVTHLNEYQKACNRHKSTPDIPIENLYKKSHKVFNSDSKLSTADHCTNLVRVVLKDLVPWELWDTPHSELLVRILAKKLDNFIDNCLADPIWLNDKLLTLLNHMPPPPPQKKVETPQEFKEKILLKEEVFKDVIEKEMLQKQNDVEEANEVIYPTFTTKNIESALSCVITQTTAPILPRDTEEVDTQNVEALELMCNTIEEIRGSEPVAIQESPVLRQRRGRQGRNEVKIYDRIIEGSVKTWETDSDLQCISMGQDLLGLDGEITLSRLWSDPEPDGRDHRLWFGEDDPIEPEAESKEPSPVKKELSPKPAELLKDIQSTVHHAKTRIGDLQVPSEIHVEHDEAAGMMEGILDFGITNIKKGLRFTGLSDDSQDKSPSHREKESKEKPEKSPPPTAKNKPSSVDKSPLPAEAASLPPAPSLPGPVDEMDTGITSVLQKEDNGGPQVPPLVKQQRVSSQDSMAVTSLAARSDSPEPQYEEAADLSSSIAKLRTLLQQRAATSQASGSEEGVWWEAAAEARGRCLPRASSRPVDTTATLADEYDMQGERGSSPPPAANNMQRLDKLFQRTVTGVFNSLKTAVGAEGEGMEGAPLQDWAYVCTAVELSVGGAVARLVGARRAYSHVDVALDSLQPRPPPPAPRIAPADLEEWCAMCGRGWAAGAALVAAAGLRYSHVAYTTATLLFANLIEPYIDTNLAAASAWLRAQIFAAFRAQAADPPAPPAPAAPAPRDFNLDETCQIVFDSIPDLQLFFGRGEIQKAIRHTVSSFTHKDVTKDVILRALDVWAGHYRRVSGRGDALDL